MQHHLENGVLQFELAAKTKASVQVTFSARFRHRVIILVAGFPFKTVDQIDGAPQPFVIENDTLGPQAVVAYDKYIADRDPLRTAVFAKILHETATSLTVGWDDKDDDRDFNDATLAVVLTPLP